MSAFTRARARVALLCQTLPPDDPVLVEARRLMREAFVVEKISEILGDGPTLTPELRARIDEVLTSREKQVLA
ncbi:hypothetical protein AU198_20830 [Mycobacterium sp. GA-1199]|uniref:hypothetical protein n=1 Tax=Mycobacterium sp. GA-1199 TaxID=1772287 RepID=UPI0007471098|nr:hypothetical protein [Mycobacterium sp. GA-1199]KUI48419.1 hypothetical protein AU198_20830 [Mycobacterium sp. GA-1199]